jgi:hypothetical protein
LARKNSKQTRYDSLGQFDKRKYKKKNSPKRKEDNNDWTTYLLDRLKGGKANDSTRP